MIRIAVPAPLNVRPNLYRVIAANAPLGEAVASAAPGYAVAAAELDLLVKSASQVKALPSSDDLAAQVAADLEAGRGVPADFLARVARAPDNAGAWDRATRVLHDLAARFAEAREHALEDHQGAILEHLHRQLTELLTDAADLVDAPATAEEAVAADRVADYRRLQAAAGRYSAIRAGQQAFVRGIGSGLDSTDTAPRSPWTTLHAIASPQAAWEGWLEHATRGYRVDPLSGNRLPTRVPWPDLDSPEALPWLLAHPEAEPWVPTPTQYADAAGSLDLARAAADSPTSRQKNPALRAIV